MKKPSNSDLNDTVIRNNADHFEVSLFLGTGKFAKAEAKTLDEARAKARQLVDTHSTSRRPIIYAVSAAGRAAPIC